MIKYSGNYRKGKAIGLPYQGSKKKISRKIVEIVKENFGTDKKVYDLLGDGGAISCEFLLQGFDIVYNEKNTDVYETFKHSLNLKVEDLKKYIISREEFFRIRDKKEKTPEDNLKLLVNSFGNKCSSYLYSAENSDFKYNLAVEILENEENWRQYKQTETYNNKIERLEQIERLQQLEQLGQLQQLQQLQQIEQLARLQQVERLQQLGQLQQLERVQLLELHNKSYKDFSHLENSIIYLDPPYENTTGYHGEKFNHEEFYNWAVEMSKKNIVLISSYEISDNRFECVYTFDKARSTMQSGINSKENKIERLFMVKKD